MTYNATLQNGSATLQIPTNELDIREYNVETTYNETTDYNTANQTSKLNVTQAWTYYDCTDTTQFAGEKSTPILSDGYVTSTNTTGIVTTNNITLQRNMTIELTVNTTNTDFLAGPLKWATYWYCRGGANKVLENHQNEVTHTLACSTTTPYTFQYEIDDEGYITFTDLGNNATLKSSQPFTDEQLLLMNIGIRNWSNTSISFVELKYKNNTSSGGGQ